MRLAWLAASLTLSFALAASPALARRSRPTRPAPKHEGPSPIAETRQLLLVTADDWASTEGALQRYERPRPGAPWRPVGARLPARFGKNGIAWGIGLHGAAPSAPVKREGDGRSPAGAFRVGTAFGAEPTPGVPLKLPYLQATATSECVDDASSTLYNTIIDRSQIRTPDWRTAEHMRRPDGRYSLGLVIEHNSDHPVANAGSCTFLHVAVGLADNTGSVGVDEEPLRELLSWLDPEAKPAIVLLPTADARRLRAEWALPDLGGAKPARSGKKR